MALPLNAFYHEVAKSLAGCQAVEQYLKLYLTTYFHYVRSRLDATIAFKLDENYVRNLPLGPLIRLFENFSDAPLLVTKLRAFSKARNELSHRAITDCHDYDEFSEKAAFKMKPTLTKLQQDADTICIALNELRGWILVQDMPEVHDGDAETPPATSA